jgi:predicted permease
MSAEEARLAAKRAYGGIEQAKELHREERSWLWLEQTRQDIRISTRTLLKSPGFTITAVLTLALGIGANTAIFSLINSVMLKTLPVSHPEQLRQVNMGNRDMWGTKNPFFSNPIWEQLRSRQDVFSGIFAYAVRRFNLAPRGEVRYVQGNYVTDQFFDTLGLRALVGRTFTTADGRRGCPGTAVISYGFWQSEYGGRADVVGKTISLDNHLFEILGVIGRGFTGVDVGRKSDLYVPLCAEKIVGGENSNLDDRRAVWLRVIGRPKPGISANQVEARMKILAGPILEATVPPDVRPEQREIYRHRTFETQGVANGHSNVRFKYGQALIVLMGIVGLVLLIACANVANLFLARSAARQREIAIRVAIGSGRWRLMRQLLTESILLSLTGAVLGFLFARWGNGLLVSLLSTDVYKENKVFLDLGIDSPVLAFTAGVAILVSLLFGFVPAWRSAQVDPQSAMKANARGLIEGGKFGLGKTLIVLQVAMSLILVTGAGLMLSTLFQLETLNPGFNREQILLANVALRIGEYPPIRRHAIFEQMLERLRKLPGVRSASYSDVTPIEGVVDAAYLQFEGYASKEKKVALIYFNEVSDRFFETLGTALVAGRDFNAHDNSQSRTVAIVNQALAKKFFPGQSPIGKQYQPARGNKLGDPVEIVGMVQDVKYTNLRDDVSPTAYIAASQNTSTNQSITFEVRAAAGSPTAMISAVKSSISEVNPDTFLQFKTLALQVSESLARERLLATLSGFFGGLALLLAMIGLYGVTSYGVTRRRNEIGIRMALGAQQSRVLCTVLGEVAIPIGIGLAIGLGATIGVTHFIAGFLYGVKANDPWILSLAAAMLALVAAMAGFLPARRASRLDPMDALREE